MTDQFNVSKSLGIDSTCRASNVYKRRGVYRKKYLNEIWALIDGTDYLVSFLDTSESREYINRSSRGHLINSLPVINLTEEEIDALKRKKPHKPNLRYKYNPSSSVSQSGTLYERYEKSRLAGLNARGGNQESEIDDLVLRFTKRDKKRYSLPPLYKLTKNQKGAKGEGDEGDDDFDEIVSRALELCEEEEEEHEDNNDKDNYNDDNIDNINENDNNDIKNGENENNTNDNEIDAKENDDNDNENDAKRSGNNDNENDAKGNDNNDNENDAKGSDNNDNDNDAKRSGNNDNENDAKGIDNNDNENDAKGIDNNEIDNKKENANLEEEEYDDDILNRDIHLNGPYPPGLGPNSLGIDAFGLQVRTLREDELSSDDGDERPSNCGCGHDGSGEVVLQISLKYFIQSVNQEYKGNFTINTVPRSEWETIKAKGFDWVLFEDLPPTTDFKDLAATLCSCRLKSMMDYQSDEALEFFNGVRVRDSDVASFRRRFPDKTIVSVQGYQCPWKKSSSDNDKIKFEDNNTNDQNPLNYATYVYDNRPIECLKACDAEAFARVISKETKEEDRCHLLHYMCTQDLCFNPRSTRTAAAMLLTLPGMRVIDFTEIQLVDLVLIVLCKKAVRRGVFSFVNYKSTGNTFAWKYTKGKQHILIVANFDTRQTTTTIICDDCPKPIKSGKGKKDNGKVAFVDILSQTTYLRDPEEMRTTGLNVILYEYEAQIFEY